MIRPTSLYIHPDIRKAHTLPARVYSDPDFYQLQREKVFPSSWQLLGPLPPDTPGVVRPLTLLPGCLDEPLILTRDTGGALRCLSNVCTHRGNIIVARESTCRGLRCPYHGRRFGLDGRLESAPGFERALDFPSEEDHLSEVSHGLWGPLLLGNLLPKQRFESFVAPLDELLGFLPLDTLVPDPAASRCFEVRANWALYCDNYLEGMHIPFVHASLNRAIDLSSYPVQVFESAVLQVGLAAEHTQAFELPEGHPHARHAVAAFWFWLFPNIMVNAYPWGLSLNVVEPMGPNTTRVRFEAWVFPGADRAASAGAQLDAVEAEDEAVVESVQRGITSRLYRRGRYSPDHEAGVHHFHRLLAGAMAAP